MSEEVELELRDVHFTHQPAARADAIVCQRDAATPRGLCVRLGYDDGHQLVHELQGQETARSHAIALMRDVLECVGAQVVCACLRADGTGDLRGSVQVSVPTGQVTFAVSPGHALAVAIRLGVSLVGDEQLFRELAEAQATQATQATGLTSEAGASGGETIDQFLASLDLTGLGS